MIALTDHQLQIVMVAANKLPLEKRGIFLDRVVARLSLHGRFTGADFDAALRLALQGLAPQPRAA